MPYKDESLTFTINGRRKSPVLTNIQYTTQDKGTAKLSFQLMKDGVPLPLSAAVVKLVLFMSDGSRFVRNIEIIDKLNGRLMYVLSDEEIRHVGTVQAELDVSYTNQQAMSIHEFSFEIKKALIDTNILPSAEYYIDDFESLKHKINELYNETIQTVEELRKKFEDLENIETKDGAQKKADAVQKKLDTHVKDAKVHVSETERAMWNNGQLKKLTDDQGRFLCSIQDGIDFHQIVDELDQSFFFYTNNTGVNTLPISTRGLYIGSKAYGEALAMDYRGETWRKTLKSSGWTDWVQIETTEGAQKKVDAHTKQSDIHVSKGEKDKWNASQLFKITADNGTQKINLTSGSFYDSLKGVGTVSFYGTNAVADNPSDTSLRGMQLVGQPGIGIGYAVDVRGNAWWFYYNSNHTAVNWYPVESTAGAQAKVNDHAKNSTIHITSTERDKWDGGQLAKLTKDDGKRIALAIGVDVLSLSSGFYYANGTSVKNSPVENDSSWFNFDVIEGDSGRKSILAWRSYDNSMWHATVHTNGIFKGWRRILTEDDTDNVPWLNATYKNGAKTGDRQLQFKKVAGALHLTGHIVTDREVVFASIPSSYAPSKGVMELVAVSGITGQSKLIVFPSGDLKLTGLMANDSSKVTGYYIDKVIPLN
ncbi:BppU family phage baseplate upper protein [Bacillus vallismortis]|uniref:phage baseplate upper protein n=1 Tax=Bacillus vallismortis TaxID=72361 RepID=UPI0022803910|nr:BppU family phage baseplate upper protein [Bacillus vallismortis]MCY8424984.1 BppU family phage baseplate upper protein [Bacillus vallismortis]